MSHREAGHSNRRLHNSERELYIYVYVYTILYVYFVHVYILLVPYIILYLVCVYCARSVISMVHRARCEVFQVRVLNAIYEMKGGKGHGALNRLRKSSESPRKVLGKSLEVLENPQKSSEVLRSPRKVFGKSSESPRFLSKQDRRGHRPAGGILPPRGLLAIRSLEGAGAGASTFASCASCPA